MAQKRGGLEVDGLAEWITALKKVDKKYHKEAVQVFRDAATDIQKRAQLSIGRVGRYPNGKGMIGRSATSTGAGVKLRAAKYPWADPAEMGDGVGTIPQYDGPGKGHSEGRAQHSFKRRTFGQLRQPTSPDMMKNRGGYMIQPAIRARLPKWEKEAGERLLEITGRAMRSQGVKVRG